MAGSSRIKIEFNQEHKMKIGLFCAALNNQTGLTGINIYSLALVESLYKYDYENHYTLFLSSLNKDYYSHIFENERWRKIIIGSRLVEDRSFIKRLYRVINIIKPYRDEDWLDYKKTGFLYVPLDEIKKTDFIHFTVFNSCSSIPYYIGHPYIVTIHDLRPFKRQFAKSPIKKGLFTHILMKTIFKKVAHKAKAILSETEEVRDDILKYLKPKNKKTYVAISPIPDTFYKQEVIPWNELEKKYKLNGKFLLYPAVMSIIDKNQMRLCEAIKKLRDEGVNVQVILTGPDIGDWKKIKHYISKNNLGQNIKYLGFVSLEELKTLYKYSSGLVMPSLFESVSLPVFEAMINGKPVACSGICGMREQLGELGIYFNPYDIGDIARGVKKLWDLQDYDGEKLKARAKKLLNKNVYALKILNIYREVANGL